MIFLEKDKIDVSVLRAHVSSPKCGAILVFEGTTRDSFEGKEVVELRYEAYREMALKAMEELRASLLENHPHVRIAMAHRIGIVPIQESSVAIAVSAPHRDLAYRISRAAIDRLKLEIPIWKKEMYKSGGEWKVNR